MICGSQANVVMVAATEPMSSMDAGKEEAFGTGEDLGDPCQKA
jgi:hypothetical protein